MGSMPLLGAGPSAPGGGGGYVAKAVHFDGNTYLSLAAALTGVADSGKGTFSGWYNTTALHDASVASKMIGYTLAGAGNGVFSWDTEGGSGVVECLLDDHDGTFGNLLDTLAPAFPYGAWAHVLISAQTNLPDGQKLGAIYISDVLPAQENQQAGSPSYLIGYSSANLWVFGGDSLNAPSFVGDGCDWQFFPGVSIVESDNTISQAHRRLFIDGNGKPVNPAIAAGALGTSSVLFSGDHTTFPVNQGSGGAFTLTGALTNASTSPSS